MRVSLVKKQENFLKEAIDELDPKEVVVLIDAVKKLAF